MTSADIDRFQKKNETGDKNVWAVLSVSAWIRLGIQSLYGLKILHDNGYLHRYTVDRVDRSLTYDD